LSSFVTQTLAPSKAILKGLAPTANVVVRFVDHLSNATCSGLMSWSGLAATGSWAAVDCTRKLLMPSKSVSESHRTKFWLIKRANAEQAIFVVVFIGYFLSSLCERAFRSRVALREEARWSSLETPKRLRADVYWPVS